MDINDEGFRVQAETKTGKTLQFDINDIFMDEDLTVNICAKYIVL